MFFISVFKKREKSLKKEKSSDGKRKRLIPILIISCAVLVVLLAVWAVYRVNYVPSKAYCEELSEYSLMASTEYERENFFAQFGYTAESVEHSTVRIPSGGEVFEEYNSLQKAQGLDLKPYMGKQAHQYILKVKDNKQTETFGVLIVYKDRVVAFHLTDFVPQTPVKNLID